MGFVSLAAFDTAFNEQIAEDVERSGHDTSLWRAGGRISKLWPDKENREWWSANGPGMVDAWIAWRDSITWNIWEAPGGKPAIELALMVRFGETSVKMFIDRCSSPTPGSWWWST